jgi:hypothetical protein
MTEDVRFENFILFHNLFHIFIHIHNNMTIYIKYITIGSIINAYSYNPYDSRFNPSHCHTATVTSIDIPNQCLCIKWTIRQDVQRICINQVFDKFNPNDAQRITRSQRNNDDDLVLIRFKIRERQDDICTYF